MPTNCRTCLAGLALVLFLGVSHGAEPARPVVPGFERFFNGDRADHGQGGRLLLTELNCVSCHATSDATLARKQAPVLDQVANRVRLGHLRKFLRNPQAVKPGTTMPHVLADDPDAESKAEALLHFLASTGSLRKDRPDGKMIAAGRDLYGKVGCVVCHGSRDAAGDQDKVWPTSVPLGDLKSKYSVASLAGFLENPHATRPSGRMPRLLSGKEPREVASYLLQGLKGEPGKGSASYAYYEGTWDKLPDFSRLKPRATGTGPAFDLSLARRGDNFALRFEGVFRVDKDDQYQFTLTSDDGSRLEIDGKVIINHDGIHATTSARGSVRLTRGVHRVVVSYFQGGGEVSLQVQVQSRGNGPRDLAEMVAVKEADLDRKPTDKKDEDYLEIQPALVKQGRELFASLGCASCHSMKVEGKTMLSTLKAPELGQLKGAGGCLSARPVKGLPWYGVSEAQRRALAAGLKAPAPAKTPANQIAQAMTTFNCYACHVRDKVGGPLPELNSFFQTTQPEMGDEARMPPPLDGVGAKFNPDYFRKILDQGSHDRPYMHTRMPGFGQANVGHLVEVFAGVDRLPAVPAIKFAQAERVIISTGRRLVGNEALGCIKCHTFNGVKAEGTQGMDMTILTRRLRRDWFHAYILDPQKFRPGTRMPTAFPEGKSLLDDILDGKPASQIEAIWVYLSEGTQARLPVGMGQRSIVLKPTEGAILYRNFIQGAGARGFGVGYPERVHLAFDVNELRLALLWQGAFIDAGKHWTDRGSGWEGPLGDNILKLHGGAPFALLKKAGEAWPTAAPKALGYRFRGYRLSSDDRPTFLYSFGDIRIEDFPNPGMSGKEATLKRVLTVTATQPAEGLHFRAAVGKKIEALKDGWFRIDNWKLKVSAPGTIRQSAGNAELLVPLPLKDGKAQLTLEYAW